MPEWVFLCGGATALTREGEIVSRLNLAEPGKNITLQVDDIMRRMIADVPNFLTDLLEVAAYIYCADQLASRGGVFMQSLGRDWRRRMRFVIPVRELDLWTSNEIVDRLTHLLTFMSEDEYVFEFVAARAPPPVSEYFNFSDRGEPAYEGEEVILFSGGLDSLSGAVHQLVNSGSRLLLVSHQSSTKMVERQNYLAGELSGRFPGRVLHVPVHIAKQGLAAVETTQRTRSFLFAAIAATVGHLAGCRRICLFENGVISFNLPIAGQVVGARATRSTHPRVMHDLQLFLAALFRQEVQIDNPFIWKTKTEVASILKGSGHSDLVPHSVSCSHVYEMTILKTHCGRCLQCIDRRFAALASGLANVDPEETNIDPEEMYDVDLLTGSRNAGRDRTMAESFVRHAREFLRFTEMGFVGRYSGHLSRAASGFPQLSAEEVAKNAIDLHRRHGEAVVSVLDDAFKHYGRGLAEGAFPADCILRMVAAEEKPLHELPINDAWESQDNEHEKSDKRDFRRTLELRLALDADQRQVVIEGIPVVKGPASYALIEPLVQFYEKDRSNGWAPENYRYVATTELVKALEITESTLRRRVERFRKIVAQYFDEHVGLPLLQDAVIQSRQWQGYRLNPAVRVVALNQIAARP